MKVSDDRSPIQDVAQGQGITNRKGATQGAAPFGMILEEKSRTAANDTLVRLLECITEQGELIARRKDIGDIKKYREFVSDFIREATRSTYQSDRESSFDSRGRYKEYSIVKRINAELEKLTRQALDDQRDNLAILEQLGTIRGLLVDLMV